MPLAPKVKIDIVVLQNKFLPLYTNIMAIGLCQLTFTLENANINMLLWATYLLDNYGVDVELPPLEKAFDISNMVESCADRNTGLTIEQMTFLGIDEDPLLPPDKDLNSKGDDEA
ncbi:hypothetical protein HAX54_022182 [Datura stramonium]|uniref:Uncharacterized protein n=1 Tax=Datura stramonium TaxID=4076 RepID=A0ABS8UVD6_DATST|nr:hypothetical protein [Datura stramonium]